jgi:PilZ domain
MSAPEATPDSHASAQAAVLVERRKAPRFFINRPVVLSLASQMVEARLVDLSVGGALVQTPSPRRPSMPVGITLLVDGVSKTLHARVLRGQAEGAQFSLGCEFLPLTRAEREHLRRYLALYAPALPESGSLPGDGMPTRISVVFDRSDVSARQMERL